MSKPIIGRTLKLVNDHAAFHTKMWQQVQPPSWTMRFTLALALRVVDMAGNDPQIDDVVAADAALMMIGRGIHDQRPGPSHGKPVGAQVPVFCRVATSMPTQTVLDLQPSHIEALGANKEPDATEPFIEDSGMDIGQTGGLDDPYLRDIRHWSFEVWQLPVFLLVWVAPKSAGCDASQAILLPDTSNYSKLSYELFQ